MNDDPEMLAIGEPSEPVPDSRLFWWLMLAAVILGNALVAVLQYGL